MHSDAKKMREEDAQRNKVDDKLSAILFDFIIKRSGPTDPYFVKCAAAFVETGSVELLSKIFPAFAFNPQYKQTHALEAYLCFLMHSLFTDLFYSKRYLKGEEAMDVFQNQYRQLWFQIVKFLDAKDKPVDEIIKDISEFALKFTNRRKIRKQAKVKKKEVVEKIDELFSKDVIREMATNLKNGTTLRRSIGSFLTILKVLAGNVTKADVLREKRKFDIIPSDAAVDELIDTIENHWDSKERIEALKMFEKYYLKPTKENFKFLEHLYVSESLDTLDVIERTFGKKKADEIVALLKKVKEEIELEKSKKKQDDR
jgi:hypothetical protein